jgi:two-component system, NarL family, sensor histidine kinase DesK
MGTPDEGRVAEPGELSPRARLFLVAWSTVWLVAVLISPVLDLADEHPAPARLGAAVAATVAFAAVYLLSVWSGMREHMPWTRRVWMWTAALAALAVLLVAAFGGEFVAAFLFVAVSAAMTMPRRLEVVTVAGVSFATLLAGMATGLDSSSTLALALSVLMVGLAVTWIRRMTDVIQELRRARRQVARLAVNEERLRFARDLHDLLGHSLSTIALKTQVARRMITRDPPAAERELEEVEALTQRSLGEVRQAVGGYGRVTLEGELAGAKSALAAAGIDATITTEGTLPDDAGALLAWTIREGVTNVLRHSGAHHCVIVVHSDASEAAVEITDDGSGTPSFSLFRSAGDQGSGLHGLAERMREAGGRLESGRRPGGGFRLRASVPTARPRASVRTS